MVRLSPEGPGEPDGDRTVPLEAPSVPVGIDCYTDPLCVWSWASEPQWRRLRYELGGRLSWVDRLGGMIPDWASFSDPLNDVGAPLHMGPHWYHVRRQTGSPIDERIWVEDPPASSYPASMAVKAAGLQSPAAAEAYLRRVREASMLERRNVARREALVEIAAEIAEDPVRGFAWDAARFVRELGSPAAVTAFREDVQDARYREIGRFPALIVRPRQGRAILLVGRRPYDGLRRALAHVAPDVAPVRPLGSVRSYVGFWGRVTAHEIAEVFGLDVEEARKEMEREVAAGVVSRTGEPGREVYAFSPVGLEPGALTGSARTAAPEARRREKAPDQPSTE